MNLMNAGPSRPDTDRVTAGTARDRFNAQLVVAIGIGRVADVEPETGVVIVGGEAVMVFGMVVAEVLVYVQSGGGPH